MNDILVILEISLYIVCFSFYKAIFYCFSARILDFEKNNYGTSVYIAIFSIIITKFIIYILIESNTTSANSITVFIITLAIDALICSAFFSISFFKGISTSFLTTALCTASSLAILFIITFISTSGFNNKLSYLKPIALVLLQYVESLKSMIFA